MVRRHPAWPVLSLIPVHIRAAAARQPIRPAEESIMKAQRSTVLSRGHSIARRHTLGAIGAAAATLAAPALAQSTGRLRYLKPIVAGLNGKEGDPSYISIARIPQILKDKYEVDLELRVHPSSTLGNDLQQLEAVQSGFIDITSNVTGQFAQFNQSFTFVDLPYAITSWDMANRLFASDLWKEQARKFEAATPLVVLPPVGAGGFRLLWNSKRPLPSPDAVKGLKFRTTGSPAEIALVRAWGGSPTPLAWTETYNGLKNGLIEGMHVQPIWTFNFKMHEVLRYATAVDAIFAVQFQVMNRNTFNAMPAPIRERFMKAAAEAAAEANALDRKLEADFTARLKGEKMEIYVPSAAEKKLWMTRGESVWETAAKSIDKSVLDRMVALR
jgi:TRAP-type C4-dicarboxylate transport system substrate-binding protein